MRGGQTDWRVVGDIRYIGWKDVGKFTEDGVRVGMAFSAYGWRFDRCDGVEL